MISTYQSRKNEVLAVCDTVEKLVTELQNYFLEIDLPDPTKNSKALLEDIRSKAEKVKEDRFNIMIAGESKSGKSTFINAYLGVELLPSDVKQCTSSIIEIKYGETFSVRATYADEREITISGEEKARKFLKDNAALDDEYRGIPVPTINHEILVKSGLNASKKGIPISISDTEVEAMLQSPEVQAANIYNLPDYNERIKAYIKSKKNNWKDIVTKIEIIFPFTNKALRGVHIIDSPGVCALGGVDAITSEYIKHADAIIFLKPISGQALESTQFNQFMKNASVERNKNALFLVLTRATNVTEEELKRLEEEAQNQFSILAKTNILIVDSKSELYAKNLDGIDDIEAELRRLNQSGTLDDFVVKAYTETSGLFGTGNYEDFITKLKEKSRFKYVYRSLETFGRKAHYLLLDALLNSINNLYEKLWNDMNIKIEMFRQKAKDPIELAAKIAKIKQELDEIQNKMYNGVDEVVQRFKGDEGIIRTEAEAGKKDFLSSVGKIDPNSSDAFNELENISLKKIDQFKELQERIQHLVVFEFDKVLMTLSDKSSIAYESLKPDFTEEMFKRIKDSTESAAHETQSFEEGTTFKKTHTISVYSKHKHFDLIKNNVVGRLEDIKNILIINLQGFVENIRNKYIDELNANAKSKKNELDAIMEAKADAERIIDIIQNLRVIANKLKTAHDEAKKIKGGILKTCTVE